MADDNHPFGLEGLARLGGSLISSRGRTNRQREQYERGREDYDRYNKQRQQTNTDNHARRLAAVQQYRESHPMFEGLLRSRGLDFSLADPVYQELGPAAPYSMVAGGEPDNPGWTELLGQMLSGAGAGAQQQQSQDQINQLLEQLGQPTGSSGATGGELDPELASLGTSLVGF